MDGCEIKGGADPIFEFDVIPIAWGRRSRIVIAVGVAAHSIVIVGSEVDGISKCAMGDKVTKESEFVIKFDYSTGLDLELWTPVLVDKSGNRSIRDGQPGFVSASQGVQMQEVPASVSREAGDVHIYGNPHIHTSPLNSKAIARNITAGLKRVDPAGAAAYDSNLTRFTRRIDDALYGPELVELLGSEALDPLARQGKLIDFLSTQEHEGRKLIDRLGGWLGRGLPFRGQKIVAYHKNWVYFTDLFGLEVVDFVERKPGIPPSARHVHRLLGRIRDEGIRVLLASSYFSRTQVENIAERAGCRALIVSLGPMEVTAESYFELIDDWVEGLASALAD